MMLNSLCNLLGWVDAMRILLEKNYAVRSMIVRPNTPVPASDGVTTVTQWQMTASMTTLNVVRDRGLPCVTPPCFLNGRLKYPAALATMVSWSEYVQRSRTVLGPTPYATIRSKSLSLLSCLRPSKDPGRPQRVPPPSWP